MITSRRVYFFYGKIGNDGTMTTLRSHGSGIGIDGSRCTVHGDTDDPNQKFRSRIKTFFQCIQSKIKMNERLAHFKTIRIISFNTLNRINRPVRSRTTHLQLSDPRQNSFVKNIYFNKILATCLIGTGLSYVSTRQSN